MTAAPTVTVNRAFLESVIEQLIELIDIADRCAAIEAAKVTAEAEG